MQPGALAAPRLLSWNSVTQGNSGLMAGEPQRMLGFLGTVQTQREAS